MPDSRPPPPSVPGFDIGPLLGRGGFSEVYLARRRGRVPRHYALKHVHAGRLLALPSLAESVVAEARLSGLVESRHVVGTHALIETPEGGLALCNDMVWGDSLGALLAGRRERRGLPVRALLLVLAQTARGLQAIHEARELDGRPLGAIHRDVSPANVLLDLDGTARLTDLGIAKGEHCAVVTRSGFIKGKFAYVAPESITGEAPTSGRSDLFSLGVLAWEALAGKRLFRRARPHETLAAVVREAAPDLRGVRPGVTDDLAALVACLLHKEPGQRPSTAREVAERLEWEAHLVGARPSHLRALVEREAGDRVIWLRATFPPSPPPPRGSSAPPPLSTAARSRLRR